MIYIEEKCDLFSLPEDYILVHCISSDFALGAGIAKVFADKYGIRDAIMEQYIPNYFTGRGRALLVSSPQSKWNVANLVTKKYCYEKPTYEALKTALADLKLILIIQYGAESDLKLGMPLIGCGLDKLNWNDVSAIIKKTFEDTMYEIKVCKL